MAVKNAVAKTAKTGYSNETLYGNLHEITRPYVKPATACGVIKIQNSPKFGPSLNTDGGCYGMPGQPNGWA